MDEKDSKWKMALHLAVWGGNEAAVWLLEKGANIKAKDKDGKTVSYKVAWGGDKVVVRLLVERGADIEAKDNDGSSTI